MDLLAVAILASGLSYLAAIYLKLQTYKYILKPLTMLWIILLALALARSTEGSYGSLILVGLLFSVVGDAFLMFPKRFMHGLIAFFVAHLVYIGAFAQIGGFSTLSWVVGLGLLVVGLGFQRLLVPGVQAKGGNSLTIAVSLYVAVISVMVYGAVATGQVWVLAGAGLFYLSDAQLALNRFYRPYGWADYGVMSTYYLAQYCLAMSIGT